MFPVHPNTIPGEFFKGELYSGIKTLRYTSRHGGKTRFGDCFVYLQEKVGHSGGRTQAHLKILEAVFLGCKYPCEAE